MGISNIGGIGGGLIFVPTVLSLYRFKTKEAVPLSIFAVFLAALLRFVFFSSRQNHPEKNATLIDYSIASVMFPTVLMGSYIGVFLNVTMPPAIMVGLLFILLTFLTFQSLRKGTLMWRAETLEAERKKDEDDDYKPADGA